MTGYVPIRCDFRETLQVLSLRRARCEIVYRDEAGQEVCVQDSIEDVYALRGEEFVRLGSGEEIRLDCLIRVCDHDLEPAG